MISSFEEPSAEGLAKTARRARAADSPAAGRVLYLDREKFPASFAGDLSAEQAAFMADSQVPWGVDALGGTVSEPAWRNKPSWYLCVPETPFRDAQPRLTASARWSELD